MWTILYNKLTAFTAEPHGPHGKSFIHINAFYQGHDNSSENMCRPVWNQYDSVGVLWNILFKEDNDATLHHFCVGLWF